MFRKKNRPLLQQQQGKNGKTTTEDDALQVLESSNAKDAATTNNKNKNAARAKSPPPKTRKKQQQQQQVPQQTKSLDSQDMNTSGPAVIRTSSLISSSSTKSGRGGGKQAQSKSQPGTKKFFPNPPNGDPLSEPVRTVVWQAGSVLWQECRKENDHRLVGLLCQCPSLLFSCVCVCFSLATCVFAWFGVRDLGNGSLCDSFVFSTGSIRLVLFWFLAPVTIRWLE